MKWRPAAWFVVILALLAGSAAAAASGVDKRPRIPVAAATIYPGEVIRPGMLRMRPVPRRYYERGGFIGDTRRIIGKMASRTLVRGRPIPPNSLREPFAVRRGKTVRVIFRSGSLIIGALGTALDSVSAGEMVAVRNVDTGRTIYGIARKDGTVVVNAQ